MKVASFLMILWMMCLSAGPAKAEGWKKRAWKASLGVLATATIVDAHSSYGHRELNPLLRGQNGQFGGRGVGIKAGMAVGMLLGQHFAVKHMEKAYGKDAADRAYQAFGAANLAGAAVMGGVAVRNYRLK